MKMIFRSFKWILISSLLLLGIGCDGSSNGWGDFQWRDVNTTHCDIAVIDGYVTKARVSDAQGNLAFEDDKKGCYHFKKIPTGNLQATKGYFYESNVENYMTLKSTKLSRVISPLTTFLIDYQKFDKILPSVMKRTPEQLTGNFLIANDLNISKLNQLLYGAYVTGNIDELQNALIEYPATKLEDIFATARIVSKYRTPYFNFLAVVEDYNGTAEGLELNVSKEKQGLVINVN